jgi:hypothetical protein
MAYQDAALHAFSIQAEVNALKMPPWQADPNYSHFRDEKVLSEYEINAINSWVDDGMPLGNINLAPTPPVYNGLSLMQEIDATVHMPEYTISSPDDVFRTFVVPSGYDSMKYINQMEVIPGDFSLVHHLFVYQDTSNESAHDDSIYPGPGFPGPGNGVNSPYAELLGGWTPGSSIFTLPSNMGLELPPNADFAVAFHYAPNSEGKTDSTKIHLKFADNNNVRPIVVPRFLYWHAPSLMDGPFEIPANQVKTFHEQSPLFYIDKSLLALQPHCHLLGRSWKVFMVIAPGDTTNLISIPHWDFDWQMCYFFTKVIKIPSGARIFGEASFDNTINNPNNPNNPPQDVSAGESTLQEMMSCRFWIMDYQEGDEDIVLDSSYFTGTPTTIMSEALPFKLSPNPANELIHFSTFLPEHEVIWELTNSVGQVVKAEQQTAIPKGVYNAEIDASDLLPGSYYLRVKSGDEHVTSKVMIVR